MNPLSSSLGRLLPGTALLVLAAAALAPTAIGRVAYTSNGFGTASVFETATNSVVGAPIPLGGAPTGLAISPDGRRAYVANYVGDSVSVIDTATNAVVGAPIAAGDSPMAIALTPDGSKLYVTHNSTTVTVIDTATKAMVGAPIAVGSGSGWVAISPDGRRAYVAKSIASTVTVIDTATDTVVGAPIAVPNAPYAIAITPDGSRAYVTTFNGASLRVIDLATNQLLPTQIPVGTIPIGIAIGPDGSRAYVLNRFDSTLSVIDTTTNTVLGGPIPVGTEPEGIAVTPDGLRAYFGNTVDDTVGTLDTATNTLLPAFAVGDGPRYVAITPNQPPVAALRANVAGRVGRFSSFGTTDPDGRPAGFRWDFGDGGSAAGAAATARHAYAPGRNYTATLTVADEEGCSTARVFTGQTVSCNGSPSASASIRVSIPASRKVLRNKRKGIARLVVYLPAAGTLTASGEGVVRRTATTKRARVVKLRIKAKGWAKRRLLRNGEEKLRLRLSYRPSDGATVVQSRSVKLVKRPQGGPPAR